MSGLDFLVQHDQRRRLIIEFQDFDHHDMTSDHIRTLLAAFEIKDVNRSELEQLVQSTPFFAALLPWDPLLGALDSAAEADSIRFGALDSVLTRRDLENLQDRTSDVDMLYAPIRFVVFEFTQTTDEDDLNSLVLGVLTADNLNQGRPESRPPVKQVSLESLPAEVPSVPATRKNLEDKSQMYLLDAGRGGVNAFGVWDKPGGKGYGVRYVDIEYGWDLHHKDLPIVQDPFDGTYSYKLKGNSEVIHGTGMLGIISAQHNDLDTYGIAPDAQAYVISRLRARNIDNLPGAIQLACTRILEPGDVLLIEAQHRESNGEFLPVQRNPAVFAAIQFGVSLGVTIVEPAGNSGIDLDVATKFPPSLRDSGAVVVAAGSLRDDGKFERWGVVPPPLKRDSNFGESVVDCFAWGARKGGLTSGQKPFMVDDGATSGASAIIAGVAILVQSLYKAKFNDGSVIWPEEMRNILKGNSRSSVVPGKKMGSMPDLHEIFTRELNQARKPPPKKGPSDKLKVALESTGPPAILDEYPLLSTVTF